MHLNVNSIFNKFEHIFSILDTQNIDILTLSEAILDENVPNKLYLHPNYTLKRRDRNIYGGGIMIYIKNCYKIVQLASNTDYEIVSFKLNINKIVNNFFYAYKSPSTCDADFLDHLDSVIKNLNLNNNLFIFGDLNMNWLNNYGEQLRNFCTDNGLSNFVLSPTLTVTTKCNSSGTLIDVLPHNNNSIEKTHVIDFPFSDHCFVLALCKFYSLKPKVKQAYKRNLKPDIVEKIVEHIKSIKFVF